MDSEVISEEGSVQSSKGFKLFTKSWKLKDSNPRWVVTMDLILIDLILFCRKATSIRYFNFYFFGVLTDLWRLRSVLWGFYVRVPWKVKRIFCFDWTYSNTRRIFAFVPVWQIVTNLNKIYFQYSSFVLDHLQCRSPVCYCKLKSKNS